MTETEIQLDPPSGSMRAALERMAALRQQTPVGDGAADIIAARRANADRMMATMAWDADIHFQAVDADGVPADWVWADASDTTRTVLYLHGGAFVTGSSAHARYANGLLARASGTRFLSVNYRLAPEHPFPAGLDDVITCYRWLRDAGHEPAHIAFAGTSAGGNLALAALFSLRDTGDPLPRAVLTINPLSDFSRQRGPGPEARGARGIADAYLAGHDARDPRVSPALGDLVGIPPLHVEVGTADALLADNRALVARARAAGVDAVLHETKGGIHSFPYVAPDAPETEALVDRAASFLRKHLF